VRSRGREEGKEGEEGGGEENLHSIVDHVFYGPPTRGRVATPRTRRGGKGKRKNKGSI